MAGDFLLAVQAQVDSGRPHLRHLFDVMANEARFGRKWLVDDLARLPPGAPVLEVGGGSFLLAAWLASDGYSVTTVEPTGPGFGAFEELGMLALEVAGRFGDPPRVIRGRAEDLIANAQYCYAFSINAMEHVDDPGAVIERVASLLVPGGDYRFFCPNYLFPYEPHFNLPTFGSKRLTERLLRRRIARDRRTTDPQGLWQSLNWITVPGVRRSVATRPHLVVRFARGTLRMIIERAIDDPQFARRRSPWMITLLRGMRSIRLIGLADWIPVSCQPIMDVRITRRH